MSASTPPQRQSSFAARAALIAAMALGSVLMWIGLPLGLVILASRTAKSSQPSMGPYMLIGVGLIVGIVAFGKALATLDRAYGNLVAHDDDAHAQQRAPWLRSMRGERDSGRRSTVLDIVMVISVSIAGFAFAVWFFGFAGSSLPGTGG